MILSIASNHSHELKFYYLFHFFDFFLQHFLIFKKLTLQFFVKKNLQNRLGINLTRLGKSLGNSYYDAKINSLA